jgi:hypothetical protein
MAQEVIDMKLSREAFGFVMDALLDNRKYITSDDLKRIAEVVERTQAEVKQTPPRRRKPADKPQADAATNG